tara:strand:- start:139 stop:330 length:192 start_codon:yes stop_codon:yes gene_type:complete
VSPKCAQKCWLKVLGRKQLKVIFYPSGNENQNQRCYAQKIVGHMQSSFFGVPKMMTYYRCRVT